MIRRAVISVAAVILTLGLVIPAEAAGGGKIRVFMEYGVPAEGGEVALYYVAEPMEGGYRLESIYGGGMIREEDACSVELAQWLADRTGTGGVSCNLDETGCAEFPELTEGLYLVVQRQAPEGWQCTAPFLIPVPLYGEWEILACPKQGTLLTQSPRTGQHPAPMFAAMGLVLSGMGLYLLGEKHWKK